MDISDLRPSDGDAVHAALRALRARSSMPVVFAGEFDGDAVTLSRFIGARTTAMRDLKVARGRGLGGHVADSGRPAVVRDYQECASITPHYRHHVEREGLRGMVAAPVVVDGSVRAILYGSVRQVCDIGDRIRRDVVVTARELATEFRIRDEVDLRLRMAESARAEQRHGFDSADRERLRQLHGELRAIAAVVEDQRLRRRLLDAGDALAGVGRPDVGADGSAVQTAEAPVLSPREIDVLAQVALGCSNAETARRLSVSPETVKAYLRNIAAKLGSSSRMESVARARLLGLLP